MLTSRQQDTIPNIIESKKISFLPFTKSQAISLLNRYDQIATIDIGNRLTKEIENVPTKFIESPLLVSLLYRTYGVTNSIADRVSTFYEEIYHALYKGHDLINKNGYAREKKSKLDFEDFRKLLRALCYYTMLHQKSSFESWSEATSFISKAADISSIKPSSPSNFLDDLLVSVPLMLKDGNEIRFFHKTLMEYFTAEYIIFDKSSLSLLKRLCDSKIESSLSKVFDFLAEINISLFHNVITRSIANRAKKIDFGKSESEHILNTLIFISPCKIGIWKVSKHGQKIKGWDRPVFSGIPSGFNSASWMHGRLNSEDYFIAICKNHDTNNHHQKAWISLTKEISFDHKKSDIPEKDMMALAQILTPEKWHKIDRTIISKICNTNSIKTLYSRGINMGQDSNKCRVITNENIISFLDEIEKESELLNEIDQLLL